MLIKNDFQRFALDTDNFTIIDNRQLGTIAMNYSNDYYAKNYIRWCVENCLDRLQKYCVMMALFTVILMRRLLNAGLSKIKSGKK